MDKESLTYQMIIPPELVDAIGNNVAKKIQPFLVATVSDNRGDGLLNVESLSEYLGVNKTWVYDRVKFNEIPHIKMGKYLRFKKKQIDKWIEKQTVKPIPGGK